MGIASTDSAGDVGRLAGVLSVSDVAGVLGQPDLAISRLIALGRLPSTRLPGKDGAASFKITTSALQDYVRAGAPEVSGLLPNDARWFLGNSYDADRFAEQLAALSRADIPQGEALAKLIGDKQAASSDRTIELPLSMTPNMRKAFYATAPDRRYRNAGQQFLASRLRFLAKKIINNGAFVASPISALYASPEQYKRISSAALEALKKCPALSYTCTAVLPGRNVGISFSLPMSAVLSLIDERELIDKAF
jgi:hypothetical protein